MKLTKLMLCVSVLAWSASVVQAQIKNSKAGADRINWQYSSPQEEGVYGIDLDKAYEMLGGKTAKKV